MQSLPSQSPAFGQLHAEKQERMAQNLTAVAGYLVALGDDRASELQPPAAAATARAGSLADELDFPNFVANLIQGVFEAIIKASIQQMEAYAKLIEEVAKSVERYESSSVSENQARDYLAAEFPDLFEVSPAGLGGGSALCLKLRGAIDTREALRCVTGRLGIEASRLPNMDLSNENVEKTLLLAARAQLVRKRQQLLAEMWLMGINRIVVTSGSIKAS
jgi:hypothetical protein